MAAPAGNEFWMLRTKHGRDKLFSDAAVFWEECLKYFKWCRENPLIEIDFRGKDADRVEIPKMRAFTWSGLEVFLDVDLRRYRDVTNDHIGNFDEDFVQVLMRVSRIIYTQKFEGAAAGFLNPNIIARDLGLTDKQEMKVLNQSPNEYVDYTELSDDTLREIKNAAETKRLES